jgi:mono/diheme cytochrome c family protein
VRLILTVALLALVGPMAAPAFADDFASLPAGPGRDVMVKVCAQCHSPEIVASQKMDQAGWKALVDQMASNGAQATDAEFDTITKYLAASFPAQ